MRTPYGVSRQEAARSEGDSLEVEGHRALQIAHALLGVLQAFDGIRGDCLQVGNLVRQGVDFFFGLGRLSQGRCGRGLLRVSRRRLRLPNLLLQLLNRGIARLNLLLQLLNLLLLRSNRIFEFLQFRRGGALRKSAPRH